MNIIKPYAHIVRLGSAEVVPPNKTMPTRLNFKRSYGEDLLRDIEIFGRVSHRSEELRTDTSWERFIMAVVLGHGDWSITEHCSVTVEVVVDRGITHEWVRHRIGAYTQESTRFVNYEKKMPPSFIKPQECTQDKYESEIWDFAIEGCENAYKALLHEGIPPQIARSVFPNALASKLIVTYNLRMWRHFFLMRTSKEAHPQMREVTIPLLEEFKQCIPLLYDDIVPNNRQIDNLRLPR